MMKANLLSKTLYFSNINISNNLIKYTESGTGSISAIIIESKKKFLLTFINCSFINNKLSFEKVKFVYPVSCLIISAIEATGIFKNCKFDKNMMRLIEIKLQNLTIT